MKDYQNMLNRLSMNVKSYSSEKQDFKGLQELLERATPTKVIRNLDKYKGFHPNSSYWGDCPKCAKTVFNDNETTDSFCTKCGKALDWSK